MLNKVTLIGRLGADPEVRHMPSGGAVANITLATSRRWKDKETGERREETEWHRVVFFNRAAEVVAEYLKKGSLIYVEGRIRTRKWQDQSGQDRYTTEIIAGQMQMLDSKGNNQSNSGQHQENSTSTGQQGSMPPVNNVPPANYEDFDDDIPF